MLSLYLCAHVDHKLSQIVQRFRNRFENLIFYITPQKIISECNIWLASWSLCRSSATNPSNRIGRIQVISSFSRIMWLDIVLLKRNVHVKLTSHLLFFVSLVPSIMSFNTIGFMGLFQVKGLYQEADSYRILTEDIQVFVKNKIQVRKDL